MLLAELLLAELLPPHDLLEVVLPPENAPPPNLVLLCKPEPLGFDLKREKKLVLAVCCWVYCGVWRQVLR